MEVSHGEMLASGGRKGGGPCQDGGGSGVESYF